jgi:hypothetical protein
MNYLAPAGIIKRLAGNSMHCACMGACFAIILAGVCRQPGIAIMPTPPTSIDEESADEVGPSSSSNQSANQQTNQIKQQRHKTSQQTNQPASQASNQIVSLARSMSLTSWNGPTLTTRLVELRSLNGHCIALLSLVPSAASH